MRLRDFVLEAFNYTANAGERRFQVRVIESPAGGQTQAEATPVTLPAELADLLRLLDGGVLSAGELIGVGQVLGDALFPPALRGLFAVSRAQLADDEALRIRLKLDTYALADLPWEYAYVPAANTPAAGGGPEGFLALDRRISLVRDEILGQPRQILNPLGAGPIRLAVLLANPATAEFPALNLAAELAGVREALAGAPGVTLAPYENATVDILLRALLLPTHIFHFAGHGVFRGRMETPYGSPVGEGALILQREGGGAQPYPAAKLALNLTGRGVRLAVFGACESGRRDGVNPWSGIAPALTRAGIPAVVAMQYTVGDANAALFARSFYAALATGLPIDTAVTEGRLAIFSKGAADERDWGAPVLYLRAADGVLFPAAAPPTPTPVSPIPLAPQSPALLTDNPATRLRKLLIASFDLEGLRNLCTDLNVDYDNLRGEGKEAKARELIAYFQRQSVALPELEARIRQIIAERG
jgi:hypothetical protein